MQAGNEQAGNEQAGNEQAGDRAASGRSKPLTVLLADEHLLVAQALGQVLESGEQSLEVVGSAQTGEEALRLAARFTPDVALVDFRLSGPLTGIDVIAAMMADSLVGAAAMVTATTGTLRLARAIEAGATAVVDKTSTIRELLDVVERLGRGEVALTPDQTAALLPRLRGATDEVTLTPRDRDVLQCLAEGLSNAQIADRLFLSANTVRNYVQTVLTKLDAHAKHEAVAVAYRRGLIEPI